MGRLDPIGYCLGYGANSGVDKGTVPGLSDEIRRLLRASVLPWGIYSAFSLIGAIADGRPTGRLLVLVAFSPLVWFFVGLPTLIPLGVARYQWLEKSVLALLVAVSAYTGYRDGAVGSEFAALGIMVLSFMLIIPVAVAGLLFERLESSKS